MKVEWTKFKDVMPNEGQNIWVFRDGAVSPQTYGLTYLYKFSFEEIKWAPIELPDPPEKKRHRCTFYDGDEWECKENDNGILVISVFGKHKISSYQTVVFACPFCGFTLEKK